MPASPRSPDSLRILSWNIERGLQLPEDPGFLRTIQADLMLLQEVDLNARRTRYRDIASELARALHLNLLSEWSSRNSARERPAYRRITVRRRCRRGRSRRAE